MNNEQVPVSTTTLVKTTKQGRLGLMDVARTVSVRMEMPGKLYVMICKYVFVCIDCVSIITYYLTTNKIQCLRHLTKYIHNMLFDCCCYPPDIEILECLRHLKYLLQQLHTQRIKSSGAKNSPVQSATTAQSIKTRTTIVANFSRSQSLHTRPALPLHLLLTLFLEENLPASTHCHPGHQSQEPGVRRRLRSHSFTCVGRL